MSTDIDARDTAVVDDGTAVPDKTAESPDKAVRRDPGVDKPSRELPPDLKNADLAGQDLSGVDFSGRDLTGANLTGANLRKSTFFKSILRNASLRGADMRGAECTGADLTGAHLEEIRGEGAGFGMATLRGAQMFGANIEGATLSKADLTGADLRTVCLRNARIREATLKDTDFTAADLCGTDLAKCDVAGATFDNANMREVRLRAVKGFEKALWYGVDTNDINFAGAYRIRRHIIDENYLKEFRESGLGARAVYYLWLITSNCGRNVGIWLAWVVLISAVFGALYRYVDIDYGPHQNWISPWYFSVVTLTTLGYGDVVPVSIGAKLLTIVEVGTGYVMLGGLLSIFANKFARRGE
jgi:uncharacterized protein YjbI with pentapeptide repeats